MLLQNKTTGMKQVIRYCENVAKRGGLKLVTTKEEWDENYTNSHDYKPTIRCLSCNMEVTTTSVNSFMQGKLGCACDSRKITFEVFKALAEEKGVQLLTTKEEWGVNYTNSRDYKPPMFCKTLVSSQNLYNLTHFSYDARRWRQGQRLQDQAQPAVLVWPDGAMCSNPNPK